MSTDRKTLLLRIATADKAWRNEDLPDDLRLKAKKYRDSGEVLVGMRDALARKAARAAAENAPA